jgi:hypothetical protein
VASLNNRAGAGGAGGALAQPASSIKMSKLAKVFMLPPFAFGADAPRRHFPQFSIALRTPAVKAYVLSYESTIFAFSTPKFFPLREPP